MAFWTSFLQSGLCFRGCDFLLKELHIRTPDGRCDYGHDLFEGLAGNETKALHRDLLN